MRRGLKRLLDVINRQRCANCWKLFPDEKGIETVLGVYESIMVSFVGSCSPMRRGLKQATLQTNHGSGVSCWKLFPDEKGIETANLRPNQGIHKLKERWKLFPDEKGIETRLEQMWRAGSDGWKLFPDEKGIETSA